MLQAAGQAGCHQGSAGTPSVLQDNGRPSRKPRDHTAELEITHGLPFLLGKRKKKDRAE